MNASLIIDNLGGTAEVARLCRISQPSVSEWRRAGIPPARLQFLMLLRPEAFREVGQGTSNDGAPTGEAE